MGTNVRRVHTTEDTGPERTLIAGPAAEVLPTLAFVA